VGRFQFRYENVLQLLSKASFLLLLTALLGFSLVHADVRGIEVWQPEPGGPKLLIPSLEGVAPDAWIRIYLSAFSAQPDYRRLNGGVDLTLGPRVSPSRSPIAPFKPSSGETPFVVLANRPGHMKGEDPFLKSVLGSLDRAGAEPYVLPLGLETVLPERELEQFHRRVVDAFPGMLAIGGGDIDPAIYGDSVNGAREVLPTRDRVEAALIQRYNRSERGMFYGICRGSQLCAATMGFRLDQDLPTSQPNSRVAHAVGTDGARDAAHLSEWHPIVISEDSVFLGPTVGRSRIEVNSRHHQAVKEAESPELRVVARAEDGTIEAMEFTNTRGVLFQFHPEDMGTEDATRILRAMVHTAKEREDTRVASCLRNAHSQLLRR